MLSSNGYLRAKQAHSRAWPTGLVPSFQLVTGGLPTMTDNGKREEQGLRWVRTPEPEVEIKQHS